MIAGMAMAKMDVYQAVGALAREVQQRIIERLEFRGRDPVFVAMREAYFDKLELAGAARVLDLGCGTGVVTRALARRADFAGEITGSDLSDVLIAAADRFAAEEELSEAIAFEVGDCHALDHGDESFDRVVTHTLISHVVDPAALITEAARVTKPGGLIVIFDGDYASMTFGAGEADANGAIVEGILDAVVAHPHVMRELPGLLKDQGLELVHFKPELLAEAGTGGFFLGLAEAYVPMAVKARTIPDSVGPGWLASQRAALDEGRFFAACNYYSYIARKPA